MTVEAKLVGIWVFNYLLAQYDLGQTTLRERERARESHTHTHTHTQTQRVTHTHTHAHTDTLTDTLSHTQLLSYACTPPHKKTNPGCGGTHMQTCAVKLRAHAAFPAGLGSLQNDVE